MRATFAALALTLAACPSQRPPVERPPVEPPTAAVRDVDAACCAQCRRAASQDPQARDLDLVPCADYVGRVVNGAPSLDRECSAWATDTGRMIGECDR